MVKINLFFVKQFITNYPVSILYIYNALQQRLKPSCELISLHFTNVVFIIKSTIFQPANLQQMCSIQR